MSQKTRARAAAFGTVAVVIAIGFSATRAIAQNSSKPMFGDWGIDIASMDRSIAPGNDFNEYASGAWLRQTAIPADRPNVTLRGELGARIQTQLRALLEAAAATGSHRPSDLSGKAGAFYRAFMDESRIDSLGLHPIEPQLAAVHAATNRALLATLMGHSNIDFYPSLFTPYIDVDFKDPSRYALYLMESGLGMPDRDYYLQPTFTAQRAAYRHYISRMLQLIHWDHAEKGAQEVLAFETRIAEASWSPAQDRDVVASYNPMTVMQLQELARGFDWKAFLQAQRVGDIDRVVVDEKSAFPKLAALYAGTPIETLQAWQAFHLADNAAPYLPRAFADAWFELHEKAIAGQQEPRARWKRAISAISGDLFLNAGRLGIWGTMGFGVGQLYSAKYFPPESKAKIETLIGHLVEAYRARLQTLDWMGPDTRAEALKKLDTYTIKVGYPDHPRPYASLTIDDQDLIGDVQRAAAFDWAFYLDRFHGPVDRSDWADTPQTNDAYNGTLRDIVFPAGILQPPVFDPDADAAVNYGSVGGLIGHELTHGFDDQGRKFDAAGALRDWWTAADAKRFEERAQRLGAQYSRYRPLPNEPDIHVNGELTMGENIADLGGVTVALDAYHRSLHGGPAPVLDGFTGDQRVFLGWAQSWRGKLTPEAIKHQVASDPHSPRQFRVNGVMRNIDTWYDAFAVKPGDALYLAPADRVHLW